MKNYFINGSKYLVDQQISEINKIGSTIIDCAKEEGYIQISTPYFENYELFKNYGKLNTLTMTKLIDKDGEVLVLRPDATIAAAKIVSSVYKNSKEVIKLCYLDTIFREYKSPKNYGRDFLQGGIEIFGLDSPEEDCEVIEMALKMLNQIGMVNIQLDIGNVAYQEEYFKTLNISENCKCKIKNLIDSKNLSDLNEFLKVLDIDSTDKYFIKLLPNLFGEFDKTYKLAKNYCKNSLMESALNRLKSIYTILKRDTSLNLKLDLSFTNNLNYYTDLIFKVYAGSLHVPVVSGGRCNNLAGDFGMQRPCCGFGINVNFIHEFWEEDSYDSIVHIALAKGRVHKEAMKQFEKCGLSFPEYSENSRKLLFLDSTGTVEIILVKSPDVPIYVENGAADIGIVGNDILLETPYEVYELMNLNIGKCRISTAKLKNTTINYNKKLSVATKYPSIANDFFNKKEMPINVIKLNGSVELGSLVKMSDLIVDIVETGETLKENNLVEEEKILDISSRLICNKVALKTKNQQVKSIVNMLKNLELKVED
ncbi:ATP phosphoribosyltransferase [Anaerosphaera multitolerans]|uniref:ATP phosphoribosyltransferase n=1 Tax=Anaerosphaera multitolerans TaxID=2487351 RepID=A0A437S5I4_9FIRM|nr:ATP phosphoribosyltransferase [Anaerosphaera multitolerans]RVU54269.1 ATP phosphoribosyltransferase [Anaerosphaera multitolerans]